MTVVARRARGGRDHVSTPSPSHRGMRSRALSADFATAGRVTYTLFVAIEWPDRRGWCRVMPAALARAGWNLGT